MRAIFRMAMAQNMVPASPAAMAQEHFPRPRQYDTYRRFTGPQRPGRPIFLTRRLRRLASTRPRQQCRPSFARAEEEDAARGNLPGNEDAPQLREALGTPSPRTGRGGAPPPQGDAQAHGSRRLLTAFEHLA